MVTTIKVKEKLKKYYKKAKSILSLSFSLAKVKFKLRNEGSYLGIFWYLLNPLAMFSIFLFLGNIINKKTIEHYPVYLLLGLIMFNIFRGATDASTSSIAGNAGIIKSMKVSFEPFVISGVLQSVFSHFFEILVLIAFLIYFQIPLGGLLFYPFILFLLVLFIIGFSFTLAALGTYISDISNIWSIMVNLTWFAAPVFYVVTKGDVPFINSINPMFYFITAARDIIIYETFPDFKIILLMVAFGFGSLAIGLFIFEKNKHRFPEAV